MNRRRTPPRPQSPPRIKPTTLRVIAGSLRGRRVAYNGDRATRPMRDSVRENLFNILSNDLEGRLAWDLFAGTGILAIEAISRGCRQSIAIEASRRTVRSIDASLEQLGITDRVRTVTGDTFRLAPRMMAEATTDEPWVVFVCPPYAFFQERLDDLRALLEAFDRTAPSESLVVVESDDQFDPGTLPGGPWDVRRYGSTRVGIRPGGPDRAALASEALPTSG